MNIQQVRQFVTVARTGSILLASGELFISPQALGKSLHNLEDELGARLLEKTVGGMVLTEAGYKILPLAEIMIEHYDTYANLIVESLSRDREALTIALEHGFYTLFIPAELSLKIDTTNIKFDITGCPKKCITAVLNGNADLGIIDKNTDSPGFDFIPIDSSPLVVIMPESHVLAKKTGLTMTDLRDFTQILSSISKVKGVSDYISACMEAGFYPNIIYKDSGFDLLMKNITDQNAVLVIPQSLVRESLTEGIVSRPLINSGLRSNIGFIVRPENEDKPLLKSYIKTVLAYHARQRMPAARAAVS
jgi:DNA-binding transcriptional LysR family regulator